MCFEAIEQRLRTTKPGKGYGSVAEFAADLELMWQNCFRYAHFVQL